MTESLQKKKKQAVELFLLSIPNTESRMTISVTQSVTYLTGTLLFGVVVGFVLGWKAHSKNVCVRTVAKLN